ncbi:MAG: SurA N-terminal domain-containing protein, partial [Deltaproteobacteria bacterium]|nr:SurA N-terminal domain-containing protein [Deltaproteobacteria bacterium]
MLLSLMRKHAKSWLIKFLIGIIAIVFIFYFGYSFRSKKGIKIAYVNGELISGVEYEKTYRNMLQSLQAEYKTVWNENLVKLFDLERKALEKLVDEKLISQEAKRIGLDVTEEEVQNQIMALPVFQFKGQFDINRYRTLLHQNRMTPEDFEEEVARELRQKKIEQFLFALLPVPDQEVMDYYNFTNEKVKIGFVTFSPENFTEDITIDRSSMEKYFEENKEAYRIPDKIRSTYILIDPDIYKEGISVTAQDIKDYYEDHLDIFKEKKQVKARHILFKLDPNASAEDDKKVREKALKVLEKAKKGEDFDLLVKEYSEGPSADEGGDLGFFSRGQMVKAFEDAAFKMKKGDIGELVRTAFGYHIIRLDDIKKASTKSLNEVREQVVNLLKDMISSDLAHEKALTLVDQMPYDVDLKKYAEENKVVVKQTDYFSEEEPIPEISGDVKLK